MGLVCSISAAAVSSRRYSQAAGLDQVSSIPWSSRSRTKGGREKGRVLACGAARRYFILTSYVVQLMAGFSELSSTYQYVN